MHYLDCRYSRPLNGYLQTFVYTEDSKPEGQQLDLLEFQCFLDASTPPGTPCALGSVLVELNKTELPIILFKTGTVLS